MLALLTAKQEVPRSNPRATPPKREASSLKPNTLCQVPDPIERGRDPHALRWQEELNKQQLLFFNCECSTYTYSLLPVSLSLSATSSLSCPAASPSFLPPPIFNAQKTVLPECLVVWTTQQSPTGAQGGHIL